MNDSGSRIEVVAQRKTRCALDATAAGSNPADFMQDNLFVLTNHFMILARNFYSKSKIPHSFV